MQNKIPKIYYFIDEFNLSDLHKLGKNINLIYRNYQKKIFYKELLSIKKFCKLTKKKLFISNNIKLALKLNLDGAYIPSFNKNLNHLSYSFNSKFTIIGSAHTLNEIRNKELQKVNKIFVSIRLVRHMNNRLKS